MCICTCLCACVYEYLYVYIYMCVFTCVCLYVCVHLHVCVYVCGTSCHRGPSDEESWGEGDKALCKGNGKDHGGRELKQGSVQESPGKGVLSVAWVEECLSIMAWVEEC